MKKYFVFPQLPICVFFACAIEIITSFGVAVLLNKQGDYELAKIMIIIVCAFCVFQVVAIICIMWAKIGIDERGVTKYLFGKQIKFFSWDSICEIKGLNNKSYWIVFCNKSVSDEKLVFCNRKSYTIPIYKRQEVIETIKKYCPNIESV